jgi:hypothetical protein
MVLSWCRGPSEPVELVDMKALIELRDQGGGGRCVGNIAAATLQLARTAHGDRRMARPWTGNTGHVLAIQAKVSVQDTRDRRTYRWV